MEIDNSRIDWEAEFLVIGKGLKEKLSAISSFSERQGIKSFGKTGDPQFNIDAVAEAFVLEEVKRLGRVSKICYFSEDRGLIRLHDHPEYLIIADPIDGSRPFAAGLESSNFSIAVAKLN